MDEHINRVITPLQIKKLFEGIQLFDEQTKKITRRFELQSELDGEYFEKYAAEFLQEMKEFRDELLYDSRQKQKVIPRWVLIHFQHYHKSVILPFDAAFTKCYGDNYSIYKEVIALIEQETFSTDEIDAFLVNAKDQKLKIEALLLAVGAANQNIYPSKETLRSLVPSINLTTSFAELFLTLLLIKNPAIYDKIDWDEDDFWEETYQNKMNLYFLNELMSNLLEMEGEKFE